MTDVRPIIDGQARATSSTLANMNPANGECLGLVSEAAADDVEDAVRIARAAFNDGVWRHQPPSQRAAVIERFAELVAGAAEELGRLDSEDMGKPITAAISDVGEAADILRTAARALLHVEGRTFVSDRSCFAATLHEPLGVVAAITPWNYPTPNVAHKLGPALATGNSVLLKPSEVACRSAVRLIELAFEAGVPTRVVHLLPGSGSGPGAALAAHRDIDLLTFTGSTGVGQAVQAAAGQSNGKRLLLECGGKSPQLLFPDAELSDALFEQLAAEAYENLGQLCVAKSRLLVHAAIAAEAHEGIARATAQLSVGDPSRPDTRYGAIAFARQHAKVRRYIEAARADGLRELASKGAVPAGLYAAPVAFADVPAFHPLARDEIFGPVLAITTFSNEAEAVALANDTPYGLSASVWTSDLGTGLRVARAIEAGEVLVRGTLPEPSAEVPMFSAEPVKQSGFGVEGGVEGLVSYTRRKSIRIDHG
jgi:acyl-CoA reductase-like NAD-dependent aldehyde dehydrogenase